MTTITKKYIHYVELAGDEFFVPLSMISMKYTPHDRVLEITGGGLNIFLTAKVEADARAIILYVMKANEGVTLTTPVSVTGTRGEVISIKLEDDLDKLMTMTSTAHIDQVSGSQPS